MSDATLRIPAFSRLDEYCSSLWLIEPLAAAALWESARRLDIAAHFAAEPPKLVPLCELVEARNGQTVAVIQVVGTLMKQRASMGGTSTVQLRRDVRQAANDPNIAAILLNIDSPGGIVAGLDDLAQEVKAAGKSKPVWAQVEDLTASAAYWVASQAGMIYANSPTALVGSIGTFMTLYDVSGQAEQNGIKALHFATGPLKGAGAPGTSITPEQQTYFQSIVDGVQMEFDRAVKSGRGLTTEQMASVRTGGVWKAAEAQSRGLIDGVQSLGKTIDALAKATVPGAGTGDRKRAGAFPVPARSGLPMRENRGIKHGL